MNIRTISVRYLAYIRRTSGVHPAYIRRTYRRTSGVHQAPPMYASPPSRRVSTLLTRRWAVPWWGRSVVRGLLEQATDTSLVRYTTWTQKGSTASRCSVRPWKRLACFGRFGGDWRSGGSGLGGSFGARRWADVARAVAAFWCAAVGVLLAGGHSRSSGNSA